MHRPFKVDLWVSWVTGSNEKPQNESDEKGMKVDNAREGATALIKSDRIAER